MLRRCTGAAAYEWNRLGCGVPSRQKCSRPVADRDPHRQYGARSAASAASVATCCGVVNTRRAPPLSNFEQRGVRVVAPGAGQHIVERAGAHRARLRAWPPRRRTARFQWPTTRPTPPTRNSSRAAHRVATTAPPAKLDMESPATRFADDDSQWSPNRRDRSPRFTSHGFRHRYFITRSVYTDATVPRSVTAVEAARPSLPAPDRRAREPADHRDENVVAPTSDRRNSRFFGNPRTNLRRARTTG